MSQEPTSAGLTALLTASLVIIVGAFFALYLLLERIEMHKTLSLPDKLELEEHDEGDDNSSVASHKSGRSRTHNNNINHNNEPDGLSKDPSLGLSGGVIRRRRLDNFTKVVILGTCVVLTLLTWLLLVRSSANVLVSWLGMVAIVLVVLKSYIVEEITGRHRLDRLSAIVTTLLFLAAALHGASYANTQAAKGVIYSGPARIVGYDYSSYAPDDAQGNGGRGNANANRDTVVTRTDLEVAWGGAWGCPNAPSTQCQAFVQGALCEADVVPEERRKRRRREKRRSLLARTTATAKEVVDNRRHLEDEAAEAEIEQEQEEVVEAEEQVQEEEAEVEEEEAEVEEEKAEVEEEKAEVEEEEEDLDEEAEELDEDEEYVEEVYDEVVEDYYYVEGEQDAVEEEEEMVEEEAEEDQEEVAEANEELEEEEEKNEELEEENEELEEELEEYEDYVFELEEDYNYYYDDDYYYDTYWDEQDWDSVWGEYACDDLFDSDMEGEIYNANTPPGDDSWPFVNVYGNCETCEAFLVDYYSTEHFQQVLNFKTQGINYCLAAVISLCLTMVLYIKQLRSPTAEKEIELLSHEGGGLSGMMGSDLMRGTLA